MDSDYNYSLPEGKEADMFREAGITASMVMHDEVLISECSAEEIPPLTDDNHEIEKASVPGLEDQFLSENLVEATADGILLHLDNKHESFHASDDIHEPEPSIDPRVQIDNFDLFNLMEELISVVETLKHSALDSKLGEPRIVVTGGRSSGKTSVVNSILGYDLLPTSTHRPFELRFRACDAKRVSSVKAGCEENIPATLAEIQTEIQQQMELVDAVDPIIITFYSPDFTDLSLLETLGYDSSDSSNLSEIISEYKADPCTIILIVIAATDKAIVENQLSYLDTIQLDLIIPVLSKIDLVEQPLVSYYLLNRVNYLIGVSREDTFFTDHPFFSLIPSKYYGILTVRQEITKKLGVVVRRGIAGIAKSIRKKKQEILTRLSVLEAPIPIDEQSRVDFLAEKCIIYNDLLTSCRQSKFRSDFNEASRALVSKLNQIDFTSNTTDNFGDLLDDHLSENSAMAESHCLSYVNLVLDTFSRTISAAGRDVFKRFPGIENVLSDIRHTAILRAKEKLEANIRQCIIDRIEI
jgi:GTPase SAR1 family protein